MTIRGVRGATTVGSDEEQEVLTATENLVRTMAEENDSKPEDIVSVLISTTVDIKSTFPAKAVRSVNGWKYVPVMCTHEMDVPGGMALCIRVLMHVNSNVPQKDIHHVYQNEAVKLRPDLSDKSANQETGGKQMNWKKALKGMSPYKPGRSISDVMKQYGLKEVIKLASNENPYGTVPAVKEFLASSAMEYEMYPDGYATNLRGKLANKLGVSESALLFGSGSDEIIVIIVRALLGPDSNTIMATPSFPQYAHHAKIEGATIKEIPLIDGEHDLDGFLDAIDDQTSVIWLCSPNNPTGNLINNDDLTDFLNKVPENILVVIDEAYYEYITDETYKDTAQFVEKHTNVIVLRTFSKAYGLAAFRIGYGFSTPTIIANLETVRSPFNVTTAGLMLAEKSLEDDGEFLKKCSQLNREQMKRFYDYAEQNNLHIYDSQGNFVLIEVPGSANEASEAFLASGYIVRSGDLLGTPGHIRVTVGTEAQNTGFFLAFDKLIASVGVSK